MVTLKLSTAGPNIVLRYSSISFRSGDDEFNGFAWKSNDTLMVDCGGGVNHVTEKQNGWPEVQIGPEDIVRFVSSGLKLHRLLLARFT